MIGRSLTAWALALITAAGLVVDAVVHLQLAHNYDGNKTSVLSQGDLFRVEAVLALVVALAVLVLPRRWMSLLAAFVGGSALVVLLAYRYWNIGKIGPIPSMYEPIWYFKKSLSGFAEGAALLAGLAGVFALPARSR